MSKYSATEKARAFTTAFSAQVRLRAAGADLGGILEMGPSKTAARSNAYQSRLLFISLPLLRISVTTPSPPLAVL
jgi:hypothetical protein